MLRLVDIAQNVKIYCFFQGMLLPFSQGLHFLLKEIPHLSQEKKSKKDWKGRLHFFEAMLHLEGILQEKKGIPYHIHKEYKYWTSERMTAIFLSVGEKARKSGRKDINKTHTAHVIFGGHGLSQECGKYTLYIALLFLVSLLFFGD